MASRDSIENLKNSAERTIQGLKTKMGEFRYNQTKGLVKPDLVYSIYFTPDKREVYITGLSTSSNPKIMDKIGKRTWTKSKKDNPIVTKLPKNNDKTKNQNSQVDIEEFKKKCSDNSELKSDKKSIILSNKNLILKSENEPESQNNNTNENTNNENFTPKSPI